MQFATYSQPKMAPIVFLVDHNANNKKSDIAFLEKDVTSDKYVGAQGHSDVSGIAFKRLTALPPKCSPWNAICGLVDTSGVFAFRPSS